MTGPNFSDSANGGVDQEINAKKVASQFVAIRERGMINASMDALADAVLRANPGKAVRWERYMPGKENATDDVVMREAVGWELCDYKDLGIVRTKSTPRDGMIRRGDLVLMMADREIEQQQLAQDRLAARVDAQAPKQAFQDALEHTKVQRSDGEEDMARGVGQIKVRTEELRPPTT